MHAGFDQAMSCMTVLEQAVPVKARLNEAMPSMAVLVKALHS